MRGKVAKKLRREAEQPYMGLGGSLKNYTYYFKKSNGVIICEGIRADYQVLKADYKAGR